MHPKTGIVPINGVLWCAQILQKTSPIPLFGGLTGGALLLYGVAQASGKERIVKNIEQGIGMGICAEGRGRSGFMQRMVLAVSLVGLMAATGSASGQLTGPDWEWATIGDPGNEPYVKTSGPDVGEKVGAVDYVYRIAKTEVTSAQWVEFVNAFLPYVPEGLDNAARFTGRFVRPVDGPNGRTFRPIRGLENISETVGWEFALRYANWLHNDKSSERWAFETGVYDLRRSWWDYGNAPDRIWNIERSPDARFWIPNEDEWIKAMYYDPNRYGEGEGGYWQYPDSSDTPLIPGYPEDGGETDAGLDIGDPDARYVLTRSYPDVMSPWGLFDGSGGSAEIVEGYIPEFNGMPALGSERFRLYWWLFDDIDTSSIAIPVSLNGFRIASIVPAPGSVCICGFVSVFFLKKSRR